MEKRKFINILPIYFNDKNNIKIYSTCIFNRKDNSNKHLKIEKIRIPLTFLLKRSIKIPFSKYYLNFYKTNLNIDEIKNLPIQNEISIVSDNKNIYTFIYNIIYLNKFIGAKSPLNISIENDLTFYLRQGGKNRAYLTVRKINVTDKFSQKILIFFAFITSKLTLPSKKIILFEKETNRYEESASILFEKLIDKGNKNVYFIIRKTSPQLKLIKGKYKKNVIYSHTFKHYYEFFKCKRFIGTEAMQHSLELRTSSRLVMAKIAYGNYRYVFLQHGVMYMVSLDSSSRSSFRKGKGLPKKSKIVVSSNKEAQHFIELGNFEEKDLYLSGLPKFDKATMNKNADKIIIMPTWRPWEYNIVNTNFKKSGYYKMIMKIMERIPEELKKQVLILPHPLISDFLYKTEIKQYMPKTINYDVALRDCKLLITDYSSISYDAFYRGSNIIFWWIDKEECMSKYEGRLLLTKKDAFGDICYSENELEALVLKNYFNKQKEDHITNFRTIVEFYDNKNTERLIKMLEKDNFI
jgi:hypothetical protein